MTREIRLSVNDAQVMLDYFAQRFIDHTVTGMVSSLEGIKEIKTLAILIEGDKTRISANDAIVPVNPFVSTLVRNTLIGMVSSLKGVGEIQTMRIVVTR